jgi:hypothetical protein
MEFSSTTFHFARLSTITLLYVSQTSFMAKRNMLVPALLDGGLTAAPQLVRTIFGGAHVCDPLIAGPGT